MLTLMQPDIINHLVKIQQQATEGLFPIWGVSAVSAALNTPIVKHMFRQRPDRISARCSPRPTSCGRIPGAAFLHQRPVWGWGPAGERLCMERDHDRLPELSHLWIGAVCLWQMDKQEKTPAKQLMVADRLGEKIWMNYLILLDTTYIDFHFSHISLKKQTNI